jgi:hypothetical protein
MQWKAFLSNHREVIAAMDFFTVPTLTVNALYCLFVIAHDRRRILHFNVTKHPTSLWIAQQLRQAFPAEHQHQYLIFDRDGKFGNEVLLAVQSDRACIGQNLIQESLAKWSGRACKNEAKMQGVWYGDSPTCTMPLRYRPPVEIHPSLFVRREAALGYANLSAE